MFNPIVTRLISIIPKNDINQIHLRMHWTNLYHKTMNNEEKNTCINDHD